MTGHRETSAKRRNADEGQNATKLYAAARYRHDIFILRQVLKQFFLFMVFCLFKNEIEYNRNDSRSKVRLNFTGILKMRYFV
jgi:hypothetical protein